MSFISSDSLHLSACSFALPGPAGVLVVAVDVPEPGEAIARRYYDQHPELFVEPEQVRLIPPAG